MSKSVKKPIGNKGLNQWNGQVYEEYLNELRYPRAAAIYKEMVTSDPTISSIMFMMEQLIRSATWEAEPASDNTEDLEHAEFLDQCMNDMEESWDEFIQEVISMFTYGFSFHEILFKIRKGPSKNKKFNSKYKDNKIGWRSMPIRSQHTLDKWKFDEDGNVEGMYQRGKMGNIFYIPMEKALLFRTKNQRGNPEGQSLLRAAYRPWYFKKHIEEIEGIGIERDLAGMPVLTPPAEDDIWNPDDPIAVQKKEAAQHLVRQIKRDELEGIVIPHGWELKLLAAAGNRQFDTNKIINRYDQRMAITLLSDIVLLGSDKVGSFALANIKKTLLSMAIEAQLQNIADLLNMYAVPQLFRVNGIELEDYPKIKASPIEVPSPEELGNFLESAGKAGMNVFPDTKVENYLRKIMSMPEKEYTQEDLEREKEIREKREEEWGSKPIKLGDEPETEEKDSSDGEDEEVVE